jgi:hypothetical protein
VKKITTTFYFIFLLAIGFGTSAFAGQTVTISDSQSGATLLSQNQDGLTLRVDIGAVDFNDVNTASGQFALLSVGGFTHSQKIGEPSLPLMNKLISIPYEADLNVEVIHSEMDEISLSDLHIGYPLMPIQPSLSKSVDPATVPFEYKQDLYQKPGYYSLPIATTRIVGIMRSMRLALVSVSPFEYDPVQNVLRVYKSVTVRVTYLHPDWTTTRQTWQHYYSPFFEPVFNQVFNYGSQEPMLLNDITRYPVKYLIVANRMFESQLQPFIQWKIKKGFTVVVGYTDVIGSTNTAIKSYIQNLYNTSNPAPSFVLFVGDAQQIPPFPHGSHISDLDFCEYTGDNIPEIYYGRFSAQTTAQLQPQIDKTLEYEQYLMPDPSYLANVTMIAGVDANNAPTYGNGQINYGTNNYFNASHGIHSNTWLYPASNGNVEAAIIATINSGLSFINYTAHGSHDGWANPSFSVSNANALTNAHKYCLAVGNCCLTNTFGTDYSTPCLGEAWLQGANKGAIGYIGASNNSYWDEDYWWGVGAGPIIGSGPSYEQTGIGAYDGMFHTHGEPVSKHYVTNDAINFCGNLAVVEAGSGNTAYYWQIYHLMGDPSVMTYLGVPTTNTIVHNPTILVTATSINVHALPGSYIGISSGGVLHGASYVDSSSVVDVPLTAFGAPCVADIVITAQNHIPYISTIQVITPSGPYIVYDSSAVNDVSGNNNGLVDCGEHIQLSVQLRNVGPDNAHRVNATLAESDSFITVTDNTELYGAIPGNNGVVNRANAYAFDVSGRTPDGHNIQFQLTAIDSLSNNWVSNIIIPVHSPALAFASVQVVDGSGNNNGILDPGEAANLIVTLNNGGSGQGNTITGILSETDSYVTVSDPNGAFGNIAPGGSGNNSGNVFVVSANSACPMGHAMTFTLTLSGVSGYAATVSVPLVIGDRAPIFTDDFSTNLGWTGLGGNGEWTIGVATGGAGNDGYGGPDPALDHSPSSDNKLLGNDLTSGTGGDYSPSLSTTYYVTSPLIDCSSFTGVQMSYYRWLGVEQNSYDHAYLQAFNGTSWVTLFENSSSTIDESSWNLQEYDLSAIANHNANFRIRFGIGVTDGSWQWCGWNIDDILIKGFGQGQVGNPALSFSISSIADSLAQLDSATQRFYIRNSGDAPLRVSFSCDNNWMHFSSAQQEIAPAESLGFDVTINTDSLNAGAHNCNLTYVSNDSAHVTGQLPVYIYIYEPQIYIGQALIGDTLLASQQSDIPLVISNNGDGRLFYYYWLYDARALAVASGKQLNQVSAVDALIKAPSEPLGYRIGDPAKSEKLEPYFPPVIADQGGPDPYGHIWIDSDEPNGPTVNWIDISSVGTPVTLTDESFVGPIRIGFNFPLYANNHTELYIQSNGLLTFDSGTAPYDNPGIPDITAPNPVVAPFWDDLNPENGGAVRYYLDSANQRFIVSYDGVPLYNGGGGVYFQVVLYISGKIEYNYGTMDPGTGSLSSATIGIENSFGDDGLQIAYNADYVHSELSLGITGPLTWLSFNPGAGSIAPHSSATIQAHFDATSLPDGVYITNVLFDSNDPANPVWDVLATLGVGNLGGGGCSYTPGDFNGNGEFNGIDVVYGVGYFKGGPQPPVDCGAPVGPCPQASPFYAAGDVNGSCVFNGIDITFFVGYLKGVQPELLYCPSCPPAVLIAPGIGRPALQPATVKVNNSAK